MAKDRKDVYTRVTERTISDLEQGIRTWLLRCATTEE